ncbi:MAG TPA: DSD1 family PLP-dependent enzyme [Casimicrobiaceae bacterium]|nr:DSD1 family PLP-dependent enzyme [Casimicrobiaceae bacterium]
MQRPPARVGDAVDDVDTPALVVDLDALERNLDLMANAAHGAGIALRPHAKSHKCPAIAELQIDRGAAGICCQKVGEAEAFVAAGIRDVLVTNEIVGAGKLARLAALARDATIGVLVDDAAAIGHLGAAAKAAGVTLDVLVEIDVGAHRCGVAPGDAAAALAARVARTPALRFRGVHAYHGGAQHLRKPEERRTAIAAAVALAGETKAAIEAAGVACPVVTGAGTGTWQLERDSGVYTEIQPGSYVFMDADYHRNALAPDEHHFEQSLFVVAAVMSAPARERAVVDAGLKAFAFDSGPPQVYGARGLDYAKASDEHGVLAVAADRDPPQPGDRVWLIPGHCDPTVNLYDWIVGVRGSRVECVWPVAARGALA